MKPTIAPLPLSGTVTTREIRIKKGRKKTSTYIDIFNYQGPLRRTIIDVHEALMKCSSN
jgi:hypothetical protein